MIWLGCLAACSAPEPSLISGNTMGTTYSVTIVDDIEKNSVQSEIEVKLEHINSLMSTYIEDSEISRFNRHNSEEPFEVSPEVIEVLEMALEISEMSGGKFDVTIGPLVNLWGFGPVEGLQEVPSSIEIEEALARVGMNNLEIAEHSLSKKGDIYVDFSAIAKGYGVDQIAQLLEDRGIENYLVEIGGELRARGLNRRGQRWRIAVEKPALLNRVPYKVLEVKNMSMATSGDYRNYFEADGQHFSHTIDPDTGYPVRHNVVSVTVLHPQAAYADGLATAINVLGADAGLEMAEKHNLAVLVILNSEAGLIERYSSEFSQYMNKP